MDLYETLNFGPFKSFDANTKFGKETNLSSDTCGKKGGISGKDGPSDGFSRREVESVKPMKYYTQNFFDECVVQDRGIFFRDGFDAPSCAVNDNTFLRDSKMTNVNLPQSLPALPLPTTAYWGSGQGPTIIEDNIRPDGMRERNQCQPRDTKYYERSFAIFDSMPAVPNKYAEYSVQKSNEYYMGIDTRHKLNTQYQKKYR